MCEMGRCRIFVANQSTAREPPGSIPVPFYLAVNELLAVDPKQLPAMRQLAKKIGSKKRQT